MALADTARLIAALELQDKFTGPTRNAERALGRFENRMGTATRATRGLGVAGVAVGTALGSLASRAIESGIRGFVGTVQSGIDSLYELESVVTATNTVIASTNGVAGQSAQDIRDLAEEYENLNATIDDKVIQSAANMLLTFTNVREDAFEPALEAALNMNEAMGGGEEGLQANIIKIGRALQDPTRGFTALSRAGVIFSEEQKDRIRQLQEEGDLLGAQGVILDELATQFGGRFAAAGETAAGSQAALRDRIEDVQKALAGPLLPAIDKVRDRLIDFLGTDRVLSGAERLGDAIAGLFTDRNLDKGVALIEQGMDAIAGFDFSKIGSGFSTVTAGLAGLPWAAIGDAARLLGTGSKALLDAFLGMPSWVQTAVLTGWGLNKLTGGALTSIFGTLASGLIKGILNMNAGVVNINAATVNGGGGGLPGVGGGGFLRSLLSGLAVGTGVGLAATAGVMTVDFVGDAARQQRNMSNQLDALARNTPQNVDESIARVEAAINVANDSIVDSFVSETSGINARLETELTELQNIKAAQERGVAAARDAIPWLQRNRDEVHNLNASEGRRFGTTSSLLSGVKSNTGIHTGLLGGILRKPSTFTANVTVNSSVVVSAAQVITKSNSVNQTISGGGRLE